MTIRDGAGFSRRTLLGTASGILAGLAAGRIAAQGTATPAPAPWSYTDVLGKTVSLPAPPIRIAANLVTAAALWDLGIRSVAVFDFTASAHPDGDHIAWGNIDAAVVTNIGDIDGNILPEDLIAVEPDIILTLTFDNTDPAQTVGVLPDLAAAIEEIAPVLVVTDMESTDVQLERLVALAASLGADLDAPAVVEAKSAYEAKLAECTATAQDKADLAVLFMNFDSAEVYVGGPGGVAELRFLDSLGLTFANADSPAAGEFWETLSAEQALKYAGDIVYNDVYSSLVTLEDLQGNAVYAAMPAIAAGQVGIWLRDFPVSYAGLNEFLETILTPLRTATKLG
jgi:iron complex transport system substrate-binding protein